jgi:hypothetical protein
MPALNVWIKAFGLTQPNPQELFTTLAATHRNIERLKQQMILANPELLAECENELGALEDAFSMRRLDSPWNNTRQLLNDKVRLSLKAFAAALEGRFDELVPSTTQVSAADRLLAEFLNQVVSEDLPRHVKSFLIQSIRELRAALRDIETLGLNRFTAVADHLIGKLARSLAAASNEQPRVRSIAKRLGVTVASISAAVTIGLGVVTIDQETLNLLPWGDSVDPVIVRCVVEPAALANLPVQAIAAYPAGKHS